MQTRIHKLVLLGLMLGSSLSLGKNVARREQGQLVMESIPEIPAGWADKLNQYENVRSASFQGWLPGDQGILIGTRFAETQQLHTVKSPLQYRRQLSYFDEPLSRALVRPQHPELVFLKDTGGDENAQIYLMNLKDGRSKLLTDGKSRHDSPVWSEQGDRLAFSSSMRNGRDTDIYTLDMQSAAAKPQLLLAEGGSWSPLEFSHDGQKLLVLQNVSANESYLSILDLKTQKREQLFPDQKFAYRSATWSQDDRHIFLSADMDGEFHSLYRYTIASREKLNLSPTINWDVGSAELSADGKTLAFLSNENGISRLYFLDTKSLKYRPASGLPEGIISGLTFHPTQPHLLGLTFANFQIPGDAQVYNLKTKSLQAWTESEIGGLDPKRFVAPKLIEYPTFDEIAGKKRMIPAFLYQPSKAEAKLPVVISIHGGPEAQYRPSFSSSFQYLALEMGIAVIAPNVRGSAGYGKNYLQLDNGYKREDSVKDIGALLDWIATQPQLDSQKVLVMGGSYGGYMTLASLVHFGDRLAGGIDTVGISHFISFLNNTKSYRQDLRRVEYGDERDPDMKAFLDRISPLTQAERIKKPLLVVQGLNDPRVPASEAEQIVRAVRANNQEAWYLLAKDEGHGFRKKGNQEAYLQISTLFIAKVLLGEKPAS